MADLAITVGDDEAAAAKAAADKATADAAAAAGGDKLILGKFKNQAALEAAYSELEKKQGGGSLEPQKDDKPEDTPGKSPLKIGKAPDDDGQKSDLALPSVVKEYNEKGEVSEVTYKKLAGKGMTKADVDTYVAGQMAIAQNYAQEFQTLAGGAEQLQAVFTWAQSGLPEDQATTFDAAVDSGNFDTAKLMLQGIIHQYNSSDDKPAKLIDGEAITPSGAVPFDSMTELSDAMRDERYKTSAKYRKEVEARVKASQQQAG
jgi:hypothetical protein